MDAAIGARHGRLLDGFVFPVPRDRLIEYKRVAEAVAEIWKDMAHSTTANMSVMT